VSCIRTCELHTQLCAPRLVAQQALCFVVRPPDIDRDDMTSLMTMLMRMVLHIGRLWRNQLV
jgi:hypothetical protein